MCKKEAELDRRNSIIAEVKNELRVNGACVAPEVLEALSAALDVSIDYDIIVARDTDEATKELNVTSYTFDGCGCSGNGTVVWGDLILGQRGWDYSENCVAIKTCANFDINNVCVAIIHKHSWTDECNFEEHRREEDNIVFYVPKSIIDEEE